MNVGHLMKTVILVCWCLLVVIWGCLYVDNRINSPEATPGYETMWSFQCLMFAIFRLPVLVVVLLVALFVENRITRRGKFRESSGPN